MDPDDLDVAEDLDALDPPRVDVRLPDQEPRVPELYDYAEDFVGIRDINVSPDKQAARIRELRRMKLTNAQQWLGPVGYATAPVNTRVVPLDRKKYTQEEAVARFRELQQKLGWRVVGEPFWTARWWCWRVAC